MRKTIILAILLISLSVLAIYQGFLKKKAVTFTLAKVSQGNIFQEVAETGQVQKGEEINLGFKSSGILEKVYVVAGEEVKERDILAKLESKELKIELEEAQAALELAQLQLNKLLAGASPEEIKIAETSVSNAQISLEKAKQNLFDSYLSASDVLKDADLKIYNSLNLVDSIQRAYFSINDQEKIKVTENIDEIKTSLSQAESYLSKTYNFNWDLIYANNESEEIDLALSEMKKALDNTSEALKNIRDICEEGIYRIQVSASDKSSLDTQRANVNVALANITNAQKTISSMKINIKVAEGEIQTAQDQLSLTTAKPRQEDIDLYQAQIKQAQAQVQLLESQIEDTILRSPTAGVITKVRKRVGENVQPLIQDVVVSLLPVTPFEIVVNIYEEDVVRLNIGNSVDISLIAFPQQIFKGKLVTIDPAQKLIEGVVYYEVKIVFAEEVPKEIKPGMTADVIIKTASKENVLVMPKDAIQKKDGKTIVQISSHGKISDREIKIGLQGSNNMVEVISGLKEGEEVILK